MASRAPDRVVAGTDSSHQVSFELWARSANIEQNYPAWMLSYGGDGDNANFMLGQSWDDAVVRIRTIGPRTTSAGKLNEYPLEPSQIDGKIGLLPTHYVVTYSSDQVLSLYVDGGRVAEMRPDGDEDLLAPLGPWAPDFSLNVADEGSRNRPWLGIVYLMAVYEGALSYDEVHQNFAAGELP